MNHGSQQLRIFRRARRDGASVETAAELAGIGIGEARLHAADDDQNPPPSEAYELLCMPAVPLAPSSTPAEKEMMMARGRKAREPKETHDREAGEGGGVNGEYNRPDAKQAIKIYMDEIAPKNAHMSTIKGDLSEPFKRIKDECHFPRKVLDFLMQLDGMEDAKRDHWLLAMNLGLQELDLRLPRDLVSMAEGRDGDSIIPTGDRGVENLVTLDDDDDDLLAGSDDDDGSDLPFAQDDDELPEPGTGAAAIAAMKGARGKRGASPTVN